jgi:hypothetical protein
MVELIHRTDARVAERPTQGSPGKRIGREETSIAQLLFVVYKISLPNKFGATMVGDN